MVIKILYDGMGVNVTVRTFKMAKTAKTTIYNWLERAAKLKDALMLYSLCHKFLIQIAARGELYTKVKENKQNIQ